MTSVRPWPGRAYWMQQAIGGFVVLNVCAVLYTAIALGLSSYITSNDALIGIAFVLTLPFMVGAHYVLYRLTRTSIPIRKRSEYQDAQRMLVRLLQEIDDQRREIEERLPQHRVLDERYGTSGSDGFAAKTEKLLSDIGKTRAKVAHMLTQVNTFLERSSKGRRGDRLYASDLVNREMELRTVIQQARQILHGHAT